MFVVKELGSVKHESPFKLHVAEWRDLPGVVHRGLHVVLPNVRWSNVLLPSVAILVQAISCSNMRGVFPVHELFWFCLVQVSTSQFNECDVRLQWLRLGKILECARTETAPQPLGPSFPMAQGHLITVEIRDVGFDTFSSPEDEQARSAVLLQFPSRHDCLLPPLGVENALFSSAPCLYALLQLRPSPRFSRLSGLTLRPLRSFLSMPPGNLCHDGGWHLRKKPRVVLLLRLPSCLFGRRCAQMNSHSSRRISKGC